MASKVIEGAQETTRDKYKLIARAKQIGHDEWADRIQDHMMNCSDPDCDICDLGESGSMIDDSDEDESGEVYDYGTRSSEGRKGADNLDTIGKEAEKDTKGDRTNLMKHGEHIRKHAPAKNIPGPVSKASAKLLGARNAKGIQLKHKSLPSFHV